MAPRGRGREMQGGPLTLERYHRFFVDPWGTRLTIDHLNHIISMHGFVKLHRSNKGDIMRRLVGQVDLQPPRRSTLHRAAEGPPSDAVIAADVVSADVDAIGWTECPIGSVAVLAASPGDAPEPVEPDPRPADFVLAGRRARSKRSRSSAYRHRPPETDDGGGEGRWGVVAATAVDSAAVDAFSNSASAASLATTRDAAASSASATTRDGGTAAASSSPTVLRPAHVGAASSSSPTVLRPADVGAASSPTPTLRRVARGGAMAVVGPAVAGGGATGAAAVPGSACVRAASPGGTATFLEPTDGAAVLPGTILGRAVLGCSTSAAAAVAAAALGPHQIAASSSAASATSSHLAAAAAAIAAAAAAAGSFLGQAGVLGRECIAKLVLLQSFEPTQMYVLLILIVVCNHLLQLWDHYG
uniref:DUF7787 domain-containing protein n=1 Tax=Oryza glumipatula TaxID=40148 RepID=A0A0D9Z686_9ORYZ